MQAIPQETKLPSLAATYGKVRARTVELCETLEIEDYIPQPIEDVSPIKWNIAHTTWFFEEMILKQYLPDYEVFDKQFGFLFNSYYDSVGKRTQRGHRGDLSRPTVKDVFSYREYVDEKMLELLNGNVVKAVRDLAILGLNHEQQHQELLLTDLKYIFSTNPLLPAYREDFTPEEHAETHLTGEIEIAAGIYEIGHSGEGFCFDNELSRHKVFLDDYAVSRNLATNNEFLMFVGDGGYREHSLWHSDGWEWLNQNGIAGPLYWHKKDGVWFTFTLGGLRRLNLGAPVCHVSYYEAAAFAEWRGMRLPTEFEWEAASGQINWGLRWEWTNSAYLPYPGFKKAIGAVGEYNGKFMINQMVLRGASVATPAEHSRATYRNFFQPHLRWQFTGIRLAR